MLQVSLHGYHGPTLLPLFAAHCGLAGSCNGDRRQQNRSPSFFATTGTPRFTRAVRSFVAVTYGDYEPAKTIKWLRRRHLQAPIDALQGYNR